jgi:hypothetical protein
MIDRSIESGKPDDTEAVEAAFEAFDGGYGHSDDRMRAAIGAYMQVQFGGDPQEKIENYRLDFFDTRKELREAQARIAALEADIVKLREAVQVAATARAALAPKDE